LLTVAHGGAFGDKRWLLPFSSSLCKGTGLCFFFFLSFFFPVLPILLFLFCSFPFVLSLTQILFSSSSVKMSSILLCFSFYFCSLSPSLYNDPSCFFIPLSFCFYFVLSLLFLLPFFSLFPLCFPFFFSFYTSLLSLSICLCFSHHWFSKMPPPCVSLT
jgi:hypothetical protein